MTAERRTIQAGDKATAEASATPGRARGPALALDFLNSAGSPDGRPDRLGTPADLLGWLEARSLEDGRLTPLRSSPAEAALLFTEAQRLRDAARRSFEAFSRGGAPPPDAVHGIDRVLGASSVSRRLLATPSGARLVEKEAGTGLRVALAPVALALAELLATADPRRVRRCAAPDCRAWFLDTSKGGRRKWCSMARCGNRAKAAKHRRKHRAGSARAG